MAWIRSLVDEATRAQQSLLQLIESESVDWQTAEHDALMDDEDAEEDGEEEGGSDDDEEEEDAEGVRVGRFGNLEVVPDEDDHDEAGAERFDQDEYRRTMDALQRGFMSPDDLRGMELDAHAATALHADRADGLSRRVEPATLRWQANRWL